MLTPVNGWTNLQGWGSSQVGTDSGFPAVLKRDIGGIPSSGLGDTIPAGLLIGHPAGNTTHSDLIIQWTAPATATYDISWTFVRENNSYNDGTNALVFLNSTNLYDFHLAPGQLAASTQLLDLTAGDVLSFGINEASWGNGDTSGINAIINTLLPFLSHPH